MNKISMGLLLALVSGPVAVHAAIITGDWQGTFQDTGPNPNNGTVDLIVSSQMVIGSGYDIGGTFESICTNTTDPTCGTQGYLAWSGTLSTAGAVSIALDSNPVITLTATLSGDVISGTYNDTNGDDPGDLSVTQVSAVPLPATAWLILGGLTGLGLFARKKSIGQFTAAD
jgi:hypothetical protein